MNATTELVLHHLRSTEEYVSGTALCGALGISRAAVWKQVQQLRDQGYEIASAPNRGYRLVQGVNQPSALELGPLLNTRCFGQVLKYVAKTGSTNTDAAELARFGSPEGTVVVADAQTAGRGRLQRCWHSPPGENLYFSLLLRPPVLPERTPQLALVTGLALCRSIGALFPELSPRAKWPNDVYLNGRKLAGVLCGMSSEMERVQHLIIGVGINVNVGDFPPEIADTATSLRRETGGEVSRPQLLATVLAELEHGYDEWLENGMAGVVEQWDEVSFLAGREVTVEVMSEQVRGTVLGISETGALRLRQADGAVREIIGGDVHVLRGAAGGGFFAESDNK
ncbi:MAG: biotin--[acetyl-CoA-carboxylase] ligase [bacterium]